MSVTYLHVVTVEFRKECCFVTEYDTSMYETAGEGETNLRDSYMWPVDWSICSPRYSQGKRALCDETRLSVNQYQRLHCFSDSHEIRYMNFFTESCRA